MFELNEIEYGSKVETLPGGEQIGEITDLIFLSKILLGCLRIPESYLFEEETNWYNHYIEYMNI
jgi:hypothetical protein